MEKRIFINDWLDLKPYNKQTVTDSYYLKICNEVKKSILKNNDFPILMNLLDKRDVNLLSCFLTSYFEDIISETNIWNAFVRKHKSLYGKPLPFFSTEDYFEEEINLLDVCFLIWYFINSLQEESEIYPFNHFIVSIASDVMDIFEKEWEEAPENSNLKQFYQIDENEDDYFVARELIDKVMFNTYLFYPDLALKLKNQENEIISLRKGDVNLLSFLKDARDSIIHQSHTLLLSLRGNDWVSEILTNNHPLSKDYLQISKKIRGFFLYKGQDKDNIFIEHIASGKFFNLVKKSFDYSNLLTKIDSILFLSIVKWKNEWWFSGVFFQRPFNSEFILEEKNSLLSKKQVNFLDFQSPQTQEHLLNQFNAFIKYNNGSQIAFLPANSIQGFIKDYIEFFNNSISKTKTEIKDTKERIKNVIELNEEIVDLAKNSKSGLVFFNPKSGIEIAVEINSAFPMSSNPYFYEKESNEHVEHLLTHKSFSVELVNFCIDNCKDKLPYFNQGIGKLYLNDIDFMLRFWKNENYHTIPEITFN